MATIAQGQLAGNLANGIIAVQAFVASMQQAVTSGQQLSTIQFNSLVNQQASSIYFVSPAPISVSDSAIFYNTVISLFNSLIAEWTATLNTL